MQISGVTGREFVAACWSHVDPGVSFLEGIADVVKLEPLKPLESSPEVGMLTF
jgi:hypothetical protein